jgi:hypothetical protein
MTDEVPEKVVLTNEFQHFLKEVLPSDWKLILTELKLAFSILSGKVAPTTISQPTTPLLFVGRNSTPSGSAPPTPTQNPEIGFDTDFKRTINYENIEFQIAQVSKGFFYLQGYHIINGKMNMKLSRYNSGKLVETKIMSDDPYVIPQIQRCHRFTQSAIGHLESVDFSVTLTQMDAVLILLEEVMMSLQQSMDQLRTQENSNLFSQTHSSTVAQIQQSFHPSLPSDLYMDFSVDNNKLKVSLKGITFVLKGKVDVNTRGKIIHPTKGAIGYFGDEYSILCESAFLNRLNTHLKTAFKMCVRLRNKMHVHQNYL